MSTNGKVLFGEMTNREVKLYLEKGDTILIPTGSTEQHGDHLPLNTDTFIPLEIATRVARKIDALVAPPIYYGLSLPHKGAPGVIYITPRTYMTFIEEIVLSLSNAGFRRIIFINGHWDNINAINLACINVYDRLPPKTVAYGINYWESLPPNLLDDYLSAKSGLHANVGETASIMAIRPELVEMEYAKECWPDVPEDVSGVPIAIALNCIVPKTGSMIHVIKNGVWGNPKDATVEKGQQFLADITKYVINMIEDIEKTDKFNGYR